MRNRQGRKAVKKVKALQAIFDATAKPNLRLQQGLENARASLETAKIKDKARLQAKAAESIRAQLAEAEKEVDRALQITSKARRAKKKANNAAKASRIELRSLRNEHAPRPILEAAESRVEQDRLAFTEKDAAHITAEKELYEANARVLALQARLPQPAQDSKLIEPAEITDKPTSFNGSEQQSRVSPPPKISLPTSSMVSYAAPQDDNDFDASNAEMHSSEDDGLKVPFVEDDCFKVPE